MIAPQKIPLLFYRGAADREPVRDWLMTMERDDRLAVGQDLQRAQYRWPVCRAMGNGLWEVRTHLTGGIAARVFICFQDGKLIALHGFVKKTRKTPDDELRTARKRQKEIEDGK